jgi:FixJ family two-component response regulator
MSEHYNRRQHKQARKQSIHDRYPTQKRKEKKISQDVTRDKFLFFPYV